MNHDDRFRSLFGFPSGPFGGIPGGINPNGPQGAYEDEDDDTGDIFGRFRFGGFGRSNPFHEMHDIFRGAETMLRHMDSMFRDMHTFGEYGGSFGGIEGPPSAGVPGEGQRRLTPRDEMLKEPDSDPSVYRLEDRDLDGRDAVDVDALVGQRRSGRDNSGQLQSWRPSAPGVWSQGASSVTTFAGFGDGKTQQRTKKHNADGSQSETVTRRLGDKEHIVITTVTPQGEKQVEEEFVNMDEEDKDAFEQQWTAPTTERRDQRRPPRFDPDERSPVRYDPDHPILDPAAPSLFSRLFGSWWK